MKELMKFPEQFRYQPPNPHYASNPGDPFGMFHIPGRRANGRSLKIMATDGDETGWQHVSVSLDEYPSKCPSWDEMCIVKDLFWEPSACVVQFHPAESEYVNLHKGCLHLWRCTSAEFPTPPTIFV